MGKTRGINSESGHFHPAELSTRSLICLNISRLSEKKKHLVGLNCKPNLVFPVFFHTRQGPPVGKKTK